MTDRIIPLLDVRSARLPLPRDTGIGASASGADTTDRLSRPLRDLRISVTDRCNFRCTYCMPKEIFDQEHRYLKHVEVLRFEEITLLARAFIANGVHKIRLTGGEPLLRKDIEKLVAMLAQLRTLDGEPLDIALTTNASLLKRKARALADAGLKRITVSLDGLDDAVFRRMNDVDFPVADVLSGIDAAADAGLGPVKINMVVKRGVNDHEVAAMARHFRGSGHIVRYIEFMDVGSSNGWRLDDVVPSVQIVERISREVAPLDPVDANYAGEVAGRWRYRDGSGEIGVISSVTQAFCGTCTRARLSTEGMLYLCLFADHGYDLRQLVRRDESAGGPADEAEIAAAIAGIWRQRGDRYSELRSQQTPQRAKVEMSYIGG